MTDLFAGIETPHRLRMPTEPIIRAADVEGPCRFSMTRAWGSGPCISWTLFNPSDANDRRDDPTTQRMMGFSYRWGFGSMVVTNVYPFVASRPSELWALVGQWTDEAAGAAWRKNLQKVREAFDLAETRVAAWGNGPRPEDLQEFMLGATFSCDASEHDGLGVVQIPVEWKCLGVTIGGAPKHPLARGNHRVPDDATLTDWSWQ